MIIERIIKFFVALAIIPVIIMCGALVAVSSFVLPFLVLINPAALTWEGDDEN